MDTLQYAQLFLTESREHIAAVNQALLELERDPMAPEAQAAVGEIFRAVHTIKGMGATMGYAIVAELAHELETVLDRVRRNELALDGEIIDTLFRAADVLEQAVEDRGRRPRRRNRRCRSGRDAPRAGHCRRARA